MSRKEAIYSGEKFYLGKIHKKCGSPLKLTSSGNCFVCQREHYLIQKAFKKYDMFEDKEGEYLLDILTTLFK